MVQDPSYLLQVYKQSPDNIMQFFSVLNGLQEAEQLLEKEIQALCARMSEPPAHQRQAEPT